MPPPCDAPTVRAAAVIVMGMSRSGTSLSTSIVAALLRGANPPPSVWRGGGPSYPTDTRNRLGYYERLDVVRQNYDVLRKLVGSWTRFPPGCGDSPCALNFSRSSSSVRTEFERRAAAIVSDMAAHGTPFVLKDVRFSRTLPLWEPLFRARGLRLACVLPFRHPSEVAKSSILSDTVRIWRQYMLAALASARSVCGRRRTVLVDYDTWFQGEARMRAQLTSLRTTLECAGIAVAGDAAAATEATRQLIRPTERHHHANASGLLRAPSSPPLPAAQACLLRELRSGSALDWPRWDASARRFESVPCGGGEQSQGQGGGGAGGTAVAGWRQSLSRTVRRFSGHT